jgi:hypothetical protein
VPALRRQRRLAGGRFSGLCRGDCRSPSDRLSTAAAAAVVVPYPHELAQVSFAVAGDVIPHEPVRAAAAAAGEAPRAGARSSAT